MYLAFQFIPMVFSGIDVGVLCGPVENFSHLPLQTMSSWSSHCAQVHCHAGAFWGFLVTVKGNCYAVAYKAVLFNCMILTSWQKFRGEHKLWWSGDHKPLHVQCIFWPIN